MLTQVKGRPLYGLAAVQPKIAARANAGAVAIIEAQSVNGVEMNEMRLTVRDEELWIPRDMVGQHAATFACRHLQITDADLRLRRKSDQSFVGDALVISDVLRDGDELELVAV